MQWRIKKTFGSLIMHLPRTYLKSLAGIIYSTLGFVEACSLQLGPPRYMCVEILRLIMQWKGFYQGALVRRRPGGSKFALVGPMVLDILSSTLVPYMYMAYQQTIECCKQCNIGYEHFAVL